MKNFETITGVTGFVGSEIERAALATNTYPTESRLEAMAKRELAKILLRVARSMDHTILAPQSARC